jgi:hypothetical protein
VLQLEAPEGMNCWTNNFGDSGARALADLVATPAWLGLKWLSCGNNRIGLDGCSALAKAASSHRSLRFVDIRDNPCWGQPTPTDFEDEFKQIAPFGFELVSGSTKDGTEIKWVSTS